MGFNFTDDEKTRLLRGEGRFVDNRYNRDMATMVVLRAPVSHGRIVSLDVRDARSMNGVLDILTIDDLDAEGVGTLQAEAQVDGMNEPDRPILARGKVVYLGQPVAAVIAQTQQQALDALEAIVLDFDDLDPVLDVTTAQKAAPIWPDIPDNTAFTFEKGNRAETDAAFAAADHVVSLTLHHPRMSVAPIETRGCIAAFDAGKFTLLTGSQGVLSIRRALSKVLGIETSDLRVLTEDVGGSFAVKIWPYPEHALALVAAKRCGKPVRWASSRSESLQSDAVGRGRVDAAELALDKTGKFLAFRIAAKADMGAFLNCVAPSIATAGAVRPFGQCYDIKNLHYKVDGVLTNCAPTDAYRGAGKPESAASLERLIEIAAHRLGIDPRVLRRRNLITPADIPYPTAMDEEYDSGDYPALHEKLCAQADWDGYDARAETSRKSGKRRGRAIGHFLHASGGSPAEQSIIRAMPDGTVEIITGAQGTGQSHRETLAAIVAASLELPVNVMRVTQGDSDLMEKGGGTGGSNTMAIAANNLHLTARQLIEETMETAADRLEAAPGDIEYGGGEFRIKGTDRAISIFELGEEEDTPSCATARDFSGQHTTFPSGAMIAEIEIDPQTGQIALAQVDIVVDLGVIVNAPAAYAQIHGSLAQAFGEVFMEKLEFDADGQLLTGSLMDYALPRADDLPLFSISSMQTPSPNSELGVKGVGELLSIGAPGILMNAAHDALGPAGSAHIDKPMTAEKIWKALNTGV